MSNDATCPVCQSKAYSERGSSWNSVFYICPVCGRFEISVDSVAILQNPHLPSYLLYHAYPSSYNEYRYNTTMAKERCDEFRKKYEDGYRANGHPVHMDINTIEAWFPKTFAERVDKILLYLNSKVKHIGQDLYLDFPSLCALLFIDQIEEDHLSYESKRRKAEECQSEINYWIEFLVHEGYLASFPDPNPAFDEYSLTLTPKGYSRIDALQKNSSSGRNVLIAMKFGDDTLLLREAIRKGVNDAGYVAVFIDEVQHNEFITPELLKYIRDSKFVVVDLTHQNNGAYFEEGYAMGLGKPVIQLCQKDTKLHFDIAQKNTIMWETESDIPERLVNRIKATID